MKITDMPIAISPDEFENQVKEYFSSLGSQLTQFTATHKEVLNSDSGNFEIDVTIRFRALDVEFLVLVECKCHRHPIKRDCVQILHDRVRAVGAHKGILVATVGFQKGAVSYAQRHGVALMTLREGTASFRTLGRGAERESCESEWSIERSEDRYDGSVKEYRDREEEHNEDMRDSDYSRHGFFGHLDTNTDYCFWQLSLDGKRQIQRKQLKATRHDILQLLGIA